MLVASVPDSTLPMEIWYIYTKNEKASGHTKKLVVQFQKIWQGS